MPVPSPVIFDLVHGSFAFICEHDVQLTAAEASAQSHGHGPWSSNFAINHISQGSGSYIDERGRLFSLGPGRAFIRFPDQAHSSHLDAQPYRESWLVLNPNMFMHLRGLGLIDTVQPVIVPRDEETLRRHFAFLASMARGRRNTHGMADWALALQHIIGLLSSLQSADASKPQEPEWLQRARLLLAGDLSEDLRMDSVARQLGLDPQRFRKGFARHVGLAPLAYRIHLRIDRARSELLMKSVAEVAHELGFGDPKHFSRLFKRHTGISPRAFQQLGRGRMPAAAG